MRTPNVQHGVRFCRAKDKGAHEMTPTTEKSDAGLQDTTTLSERTKAEIARYKRRKSTTPAARRRLVAMLRAEGLGAGQVQDHQATSGLPEVVQAHLELLGDVGQPDRPATGARTCADRR